MKHKDENTDNDNITYNAIPEFDSQKNWTEDYKHENGNYICKCYNCKEYFFGHKRRPLCKECGGNLKTNNETIIDNSMIEILKQRIKTTN